ncbi:MAG: hypothetical protein ABW167_19505 [Baekduia sp.]
MADGLSEPEILQARQGFPDAQASLDGARLSLLDGLYGLGWYGSSLSRERGSFALVNRGGPLEDLVGDRLRLTDPQTGRSVVVYAFASEGLDHDIHVTRRAYAAVSLLAVDRIDVTVEVLTS